MSIIKRIFKRQENVTEQKADKTTDKIVLAKYFHTLLESGESPFQLALNSLEELEKTAKSEEELMHFLLEDIIFASLYATFYEQILIRLNDNRDVLNELIDRFSEDASEREKMIAMKTQEHFEFVLNQGICSGCGSCDNHPDLAALIRPYHTWDIEFFLTLYVGMQVIQSSMENLLYDIAPTTPDALPDFQIGHLLKFRQYLYAYTDKSLNPA